MAEKDKDGKVIKRSTGPYGWNTIMKHGEKYMTRIWLGRLRMHVFYKGDDDRDPHDHPWAFWTFPFTSYVEEVTFKANGAGTNGIPEYATRLQVVPAWRWNFRPAEHCHKVLGVFIGVYFAHKKDGAFVGIVDHPISKTSFETFARYGYTLVPHWEPLDGRRLVTIVFRTGFQRRWGFLKSRDGKWCWQDFKAYLNDNGGNAPCE